MERKIEKKEYKNMKQEKIIISQNSVNSKELYDIVYSNITVVNLLKEQGLSENDIHKDALGSYYADYYLAQLDNGGFSQFVYNTRWKKIVNDRVAYALGEMKAVKHLALFNKTREKMDTISTEELNRYFESDYFGNNEMRDIIHDLENVSETFYNLEENITTLNAKWLKNHKDVQILSIEDMILRVEEISGKKVKR